MGYYSGRVVAITGAGAGIGRALAIALAGQGSTLALSDRDAASLAETHRLCHAAPAVGTHLIDVTDRQAMIDYASLVVAEFGRVEVVLAVAGVMHVGSVMGSEYSDVERVVDVDFWGVVHTATAFLPHLIASGDGHFVGVSSAYGLIGAPMHSAYCAAKAAVRGFIDALRQEMVATHQPVAVTCVYPGGVRTSIMQTGSYARDADRPAVIARFDRTVARLDPTEAAVRILRGVRMRRAEVLVGMDAHAVSLALRLAGPSYQRVLSTLLKLTQVWPVRLLTGGHRRRNKRGVQDG
ncbi:SDR family NAD(P)-dependent oxidoreductase [Actinophytocola xanthii]|uniref:Acetoin dehydrogenase n=1 Tax=Actinophytocola xanthii TaxID=1912961 RepID=A0A1Q8BY96_9PSEU|nr:SDR family NAD(P)-dependent oxidoreductase [Actinophytocola xanthii]OLF07079.1 hypothetical protein BU204_35805 [Actinophytocola xanthii]